MLAREPGPGDLQTALALVARAIAHSLELRDVWDRVADACRLVVPFDGMGISRFEPGDRIRISATAGDPAATDLQEVVFARSDFSPRMRPENPGSLVIEDAERELDPAFALDRRLLERGYKSLLRISLNRGEERLGSLVLVSFEKGRFGEQHLRGLTLVGELLSLAVAHETMARGWRERRRRRDALERLIPTLTETLDVREVFERIATIAQEIVPHDYLSLGLNSEGGRRVRIHAKHGADLFVRELPEFEVPEPVAHLVDRDFLVTRDAEFRGARRLRLEMVEPADPPVIELEVDDFWHRVYREVGVRSAVRARVQMNGKTLGGLEFNSRQRGAYGREDAEFALRVAEHVALALAHQQLAEQSRRAVAAQDRAARLEERVQVLAHELQSLSPHRALGRSKAWRDVLAQAAKVAPTDTTVLLTGESGTGKEVVARYLHRASSRNEGPFVALNCAALPEQLLESELFGHEKGAFTGALAARAGRIEQAAGGVLFLDEVGEMSLPVQAKFLRVLQEREYQRLGGTKTLRAEVRVLAATNRDLKAAIARGTFREDLFYRLAVFDVGLPPLRDRGDDIPLLVEAFLEELGRSVGRPAAGVSAEALEKLVSYPWPGNVRELRNAIERAMILCEGGLITSEHLPITIASAALPGPGSLESAEREMIVQALARAGNNKSKAARFLGITRAQLRSRIEKHGLVAED
jgi:transcriptional regulator with GAF, ATPase, and Fis domain